MYDNNQRNGSISYNSNVNTNNQRGSVRIDNYSSQTNQNYKNQQGSSKFDDDNQSNPRKIEENMSKVSNDNQQQRKSQAGNDIQGTGRRIKQSKFK